MSLKDLEIKTEYRNLLDNVVNSFYLPLLKEAICYQRAVGFFSSSSLMAVSVGIGELAKNGGKIQIVASPHLSEEDVKAIKLGYEKRDKIIEDSLVKQINEFSINYESMERFNLLANLIAAGILDIRIAYTTDNNGIGMYHEKLGIISDDEGNQVAFSGSMNETETALNINYETIDVYCSWKNESEIERVDSKRKAFETIWNNLDPCVTVIEFPKLTEAFVKRFKRKEANFQLDQITISCLGESLGKYEIRKPESISLYEYQKNAIENWVQNDYIGIFDMATGTGKTITGLCALTKLVEEKMFDIATIIVCPYQHLVEQWVEDILKFNIKPIIGYSKSPQKNWKQRLSRAIRSQKIKTNGEFFCFICTNATFASEYVQEKINQITKPIFLLVDEAHNFGAEKISKLLDDRFTYRLALSATLDRHRDPEGTDKLHDFFGEICISYDLQKAIQEEKLTPYKYYPEIVYLDQIELEQYEEISYELSKHLTVNRKGETILDSYGKMLAIKRARIVAGAVSKLDRLREVIDIYKDNYFILVYCGATNVLEENKDISKTEIQDIKQINAVTQILGNEFNMRVAKFTAEEDISERKAIISHYKTGDDLQAIVAIKCLDEGVNIPGIRTAIILASSTNPKEYIQRRGRVLRKSEGKEYAEIIDFITLPRKLDEVNCLTIEQKRRDISLVLNELKRVREFGDISLNPIIAKKIIWEVCDCYDISYDLDFDFKGGII